MLKVVSLLAATFAMAGTAIGAPLVVDEERSEFVVQVKATGHSFPVALKDYQADIELGSDGRVESARFSFSPKALDSDNKKRNRKMLEWLEVESHPEIVFELKDVKTDGDGGTVGLGDLTLHGVTRTVEIPFSLESDSSEATLTGSATIDYTNYSLEVITMMFFKVNPELRINFKLVGSQG